MVGRRSLPFRMAYFRDELLVSGRVPSQSLTCFTWKWHQKDQEIPNLETIIFGFHVKLGECRPWTQQVTVICARLGHLPQQCQGLFFVECCFCLQFHLFKNSIKNQFGWWNMMVFHQDLERILGFKNSARRISRLQVLRRTAGPAARLGSCGLPWRFSTVSTPGNEDFEILKLTSYPIEIRENHLNHPNLHDFGVQNVNWSREENEWDWCICLYLVDFYGKGRSEHTILIWCPMLRFDHCKGFKLMFCKT